MSCLIKIKASRDSFSANERRIADFIIENSQFLRDYSSQQLATALSVSQSSIVKFSQKLGYKGYPDLKMAINESVIKLQANNAVPLEQSDSDEDVKETFQALVAASQEALEHCLSINKPQAFSAMIKELKSASKVVLFAGDFARSHAKRFQSALFQQDKICQYISSEQEKDIAIIESLNKGDALLLMEDVKVSSHFVSVVTKASKLGVNILLINKTNDSKLHTVAKQRLLWCDTETQADIASFQSESCLLALNSYLLMLLTA